MTAEGRFCPDTELIHPSGLGVSAIQAWAYRNIVPLNVTIETTMACNIKCLHCYNCDRDDHGVAGNPPAAPLTDDEIVDLIGQVRAAGCLFLSLTGGEVLAHPGLFRFLDRARDLHLAVQLLTNGTLLRPGMAGRLSKYKNLVGVSISLYGATAAVHDGITQIPGSFDRTWQGAVRMRKLGVGVRLKFLVMRQNAHELSAMRQNATAHGFAHLVDMQVTARHDGTDGSLSTRVPEDQLEALYGGPLGDLIPKRSRQVTDENFPCNCARGNCAISAAGDVQPCISVPLSAGNIRQQSFAEIWKSSPAFERIRGLKMADYAKCGPCGDKGTCNRSRGAAYTATGDYTSADPYVCAGAAALGRLVKRPLAQSAVGPVATVVHK